MISSCTQQTSLVDRRGYELQQWHVYQQEKRVVKVPLLTYIPLDYRVQRSNVKS